MTFQQWNAPIFGERTKIKDAYILLDGESKRDKKERITKVLLEHLQCK